MSNGAFTAKRLRKGIKLDRVNASDFLNYHFIYSCEQCSHFCPEKKYCTIGYQSSLHNKDAQLKRYYSHGHMALCRFIEID